MFTTSAASEASSVTLRDRLLGEEATTSPVKVLELFSSFGTASDISSFGAAGFSAGDVLAMTFFSPVDVLPTGLVGGAVVAPGRLAADGPVDMPSESVDDGGSGLSIDRVGAGFLLDVGAEVVPEGPAGPHDGSDT